MGDLSELTDKKYTLTTMFTASQLYKENLLNNNMLMVFLVEPNKYSYIEVVFEAKHFQHLTGTKIPDSFLAVDFFERCLDKRLSINDFELAEDGTTILKMHVIIELMNISRVSNMVGTYNNLRPKLYTEKLVGNIRGCMGFIEDSTIPYYVPNTLLETNTKDAVQKDNRLMFVYMKKTEEQYYTFLSYVAKNIDYMKPRFQKEIAEKIDFDNLKVLEGILKSNVKKAEKQLH